jgi:hypothetical protein
MNAAMAVRDHSAAARVGRSNLTRSRFDAIWSNNTVGVLLDDPEQLRKSLLDFIGSSTDAGLSG